MKENKKLIIGIDSPAAAGAGTQAKLIAKYYNLYHLDTGKLYRYLGLIRIKEPKKFNYKYIKNKIKKLKISDLSKKNLVSNEVAVSASKVSKIAFVRKAILNFQRLSAIKPPRRYNGSVLDGRDINHRVLPNAKIKFFITASLKVRARRRYNELKELNRSKSLKYPVVLESLKKRDKSDRDRPKKLGKLFKTKDSFLINTTNLTKKACFLKIKKIIDNKIKNGNI